MHIYFRNLALSTFHILGREPGRAGYKRKQAFLSWGNVDRHRFPGEFWAAPVFSWYELILVDMTHLCFWQPLCGKFIKVHGQDRREAKFRWSLGAALMWIFYGRRDSAINQGIVSLSQNVSNLLASPIFIGSCLSTMQFSCQFKTPPSTMTFISSLPFWGLVQVRYPNSDELGPGNT